MKKALGAKIRLAFLACVGTVAACTADGAPGVNEVAADAEADRPVEGRTASMVTSGGGPTGRAAVRAG